MGSRLQLSEILHDLLGSDEVYFQPPSNVQMRYPSIVYALDDAVVEHADNRPYRHTNRYLITAIDKDPDSKIWERILQLPTATFVRRFYADQLNHTVINLHF